MLKQINYAKKSDAALREFQAAVRRDAVFVLLAASDSTLQKLISSRLVAAEGLCVSHG